MATAPALSPGTARENVRPFATQETPGIWGRASTWGLLLLLLYFALDGVSPFVNEPTATRAVQTGSAGGVLVDRASKLLVFAACMFFVLPWHRAIRQMSKQAKLIISFPVLAILLSPLSQLPSRTISSSVLLLGGVLLLYSMLCRFTLDQILELLLILGTATMAASIVFALALPQYGLDQMGGHADAWKGIFSAKNYLGNLALFFLTAAVSYLPRTSWLRSLRWLQILLCVVGIVFSRAATAYLLSSVYLVYLATVTVLHRFRKKDYLLLGLLLLLALSAILLAFAVWPDVLFNLLGKDVTLTGRTGIWTAVLESIIRRPLLGYGYQAFWLGLEGESYRVILEVSWVLAQAQNGFLDVTLELGVVGLLIVLLIFGFAFRDGVVCLLRSRNQAQLRAVEWYLAIVLLTFIYNLDESFLFEPKHLGSMMFLLSCVGLKIEWKRLRTAGNLPITFPKQLRSQPLPGENPA